MKNLKRIIPAAVGVLLLGTALASTFAGLTENPQDPLSLIHDQLETTERRMSVIKPLCSELDGLREKRDGLIKEVNDFINHKEPTSNKVAYAESGNFTPTTEGGLDAFLEKNGAEFVKEAGDVFRAAGLIHNVKPEVLVCIAQADSSLGKALKTSNNIGNVGNNDRGNIVSYPTLEAGIDAIGRVLNNQYMRGNQVIGELSGNGLVALHEGHTHTFYEKNPCLDKTGSNKCYATSFGKSGFWNKNVKTCLQNIHQDPSIDESFEFRVL